MGGKNCIINLLECESRKKENKMLIGKMKETRTMGDRKQDTEDKLI